MRPSTNAYMFALVAGKLRAKFRALMLYLWYLFSLLNVYDLLFFIVNLTTFLNVL